MILTIRVTETRLASKNIASSGVRSKIDCAATNYLSLSKSLCIWLSQALWVL